MFFFPGSSSASNITWTDNEPLVGRQQTIDKGHFPLAVSSSPYAISFGDGPFMANEMRNMPDFQGHNLQFEYNDNLPNPNNDQYPMLPNNSDYYDDGDYQQSESKLKASLRPRERRNKKKRPPDYYKEPEVNHYFSGYSHHPAAANTIPVIPDLSRPPPGHPAMYGISPTHIPVVHAHGHIPTLGPHVHTGPRGLAGNIPPQGMAPLVNQSIGAYNVNTGQCGNPGIPSVGVHSHNFPNPAMLGFNAGVGNQLNTQFNNVTDMGQQHNSGELMEVIVDNSDKVQASDNVHIEPRIESYQNHDHDRTSCVHESHEGSANNVKNIIAEQQKNTGTQITMQNMVQNTNSNVSDSQGATKQVHVDISVKNVPEDNTASQTAQIQQNIVNREPAIQNEQDANIQSMQVDKRLTEDQKQQNECVKDPMDSSQSVGDKMNNTQNIANDSNNALKEEGSTPDKDNAKPEAKPEPPKPKAFSWAGLFKAPGQTSQSGDVNNSDTSGGSLSQSVGNTKEMEFPAVVTVSAEQDSIAKDLGGTCLYCSTNIVPHQVCNSMLIIMSKPMPLHL